MQSAEVVSRLRRLNGGDLWRILGETAEVLLPRELARSLVLPLVIFLVVATVALAFDRGYGFELLGVAGLLASRAAYRAGVREGEYREAFRCSQREYEELKRNVLGDAAQR